VKTLVVIVDLSAFADTVTPLIFSPLGEVTEPVSRVSANAAREDRGIIVNAMAIK
jgi:hypothetical protein